MDIRTKKELRRMLQQEEDWENFSAMAQSDGDDVAFENNAKTAIRGR